MDPRSRQLRIRSGVVRRLWKEAGSYRAEAATARTKLAAGRAEERAECELKQLDALLQEALLMVPDSTRRLNKAQEELKNILDSELDLKNTEEYKTAAKILEDSLADSENDQVIE